MFHHLLITLAKALLQLHELEIAFGPRIGLKRVSPVEKPVLDVELGGLCEKTVLFGSFPYVCPEPVLANVRFLDKMTQKPFSSQVPGFASRLFAGRLCAWSCNQSSNTRLASEAVASGAVSGAASFSWEFSIGGS